MTSGLSSLGGVDEGAPVGDLADDVAFCRQQLLERAEQERVIVGEQDSRSTHTQHSIRFVEMETDRFGFGCLSPHDSYGTGRRCVPLCRIGRRDESTRLVHAAPSAVASRLSSGTVIVTDVPPPGRD